MPLNFKIEKVFYKSSIICAATFASGLLSAAQTSGKADVAALSDAGALYAEGKYDEASEAFFKSECLAFFAKYQAPSELTEFFLSSPELAADFISTLSPKDDHARVADALAQIWKADSESFKKFPRLAVAISIVFDTPPPSNWPHAQVSEKYLPRKFPTPAEAFDSWKTMRAKGRLLFKFEKLSLDELKYLVATLATDEDREWAQKSVSINASNIDKLYQSVPYNFGRLNAKKLDWNSSDYRLKTIREEGGICTEQAYFTSEVAKARGIPAFIFSGAGSDGFHAWTGAMKKPGEWDFRIGRYEGARFVTGTTLDPQTWEIASDHSLESLREGFRNGKKYRDNEFHTIFAKRFFESGKYAEAVKSAQSAIACDKRNAESWRVLANSQRKSGADAREIRKTLDEAVKSFFKYPDIDAEFRRELIAEFKAAGDKDSARKLSTSIIIKTKSSRPDIAMAFARSELEEDIASGEAEKLYTSYKRLLGVFKADSAMATTEITIPILNALLKKGKVDETDGIMKMTRKTLKIQKDSILSKLLDDIDRQLSEIKTKIKEATGK